MWDLPGSGIKPVSPALADGFFTTEGKHSCLFFNLVGLFYCVVVSVLFFFFCHMACRILRPWSGIEPTALHWKPSVLTTGSSQFFICFEYWLFIRYPTCNYLPIQAVAFSFCWWLALLCRSFLVWCSVTFLLLLSLSLVWYFFFHIYLFTS